MIRIENLDKTLDPDGANGDEGAIRFLSFEANVILAIDGWKPIRLHTIPLIQFFISLARFETEIWKDGSWAWEIFDTGLEFHVRLVGETLIWTQSSSNAATCFAKPFFAEAKLLARATIDELLECHPQLSSSVEIARVERWLSLGVGETL